MILRKIFQVAVAVTVGATTIAASASAANRSVSTTSHAIIGAVLASGNPGVTLSDGYTTIDTESLDCLYGRCTLGMTIMSAIGKATCTLQEWAIVALVDGKSVDGGPFVDTVPGSDKTQTRNWQGVYQVHSGTHTVAFQIFTPCPVTAYQWSVNYLITTP